MLPTFSSNPVESAQLFLKLIKEANGNSVVLTGAGVSTDSGIPDFRGPKGLYSSIPQNVFDIDTFYNNPAFFWKIAKERLSNMLYAQPNITHKLIALLEQKKLIKAVITQNIDGLHQSAGSKKVIELHGNLSKTICLKCKTLYNTEEVLQWGEEIPRCKKCGGILKPDVVFFGEMLPTDALEEAKELAESVDLMITMGSSLVVYPAASLPQLTIANGGKVVIITKGETGLDYLANYKFDVPLSDFSNEVLKLLDMEGL